MGLEIVKAALLLSSSLLIGSLPLIDGLVRLCTKKHLAEMGTGNLSVSAAFYHGGTGPGLMAVLSEAAKGIGVVWLARSLFPTVPAWELVALIALVIGRYRWAGGAGTTNTFWGYLWHDWHVILAVAIVAGGGFVLLRRRQVARLLSLVLIPIFEAAWGGTAAEIAAATGLSLLIAWIYAQIPDDLALPSSQSPTATRTMFRFLQGRSSLLTLDDRPVPHRMGQKAATLAALKQAGYAVPRGWVLPPTGDPRSLLAALTQSSPTPWEHPWIVRSSALDEDRTTTSAAGQYQSVANVTTPEAFMQAVQTVRESGRRAAAQQYRRDRGLTQPTEMALLVQPQIQGVYSGVAFSRDPVEPGEAVWVEAIAGSPDQVVSGQVTPETHRVIVAEADLIDCPPSAFGTIAIDQSPTTEGVPPAIVQQVAQLARHLELHAHGIPQDIEWSFDGNTLWLLQARPITTLAPLWTRKIAAEVIPGVIRPLTWSINRPLTCGVWGKLFTLVLGKRAAGLDFTETATLHYSRAYFNATLLGQLFRRMGLPPESLEFLTLGSKFSPPPLLSTLRNVPGLTRLLRREWRLIQDFETDHRQHFAPLLTQLASVAPTSLPPKALLTRIEHILTALERATYYSILAPLSFALRRALFKIPETALDSRQLPEVASVQAIQQLAQQARETYPQLQAAITADTSQPDGAWRDRLQSLQATDILTALDRLVETYGFLSEVGTDIAVPTWREDPRPLETLFAQFLQAPPKSSSPETALDRVSAPRPQWQQRQVQQRLNLKGQVATVYLSLLAELRWSIVALEDWAIAQGLLTLPGDIFFLTYTELQTVLVDEAATASTLQTLVAERRSQFRQHQSYPTVPFVVYGNNPPPNPTNPMGDRPGSEPGLWQGIGASVGEAEGTVMVLSTLRADMPIPPDTILVVPYTDAGWAPLLARAAGVIAEVGGRLSHGAIVAREYRIPAVMNIANATQVFQSGQRVRLDGRAGIVELLASEH